MTFTQAMTAVGKGKRARRELWDTWLVKSGSWIEFDLKRKDRDYAPTEIDRNATDWVVA